MNRQADRVAIRTAAGSLGDVPTRHGETEEGN